MLVPLWTALYLQQVWNFPFVLGFGAEIDKRDIFFCIVFIRFRLLLQNIYLCNWAYNHLIALKVYKFLKNKWEIHNGFWCFHHTFSHFTCLDLTKPVSSLFSHSVYSLTLGESKYFPLHYLICKIEVCSGNRKGP